MSRMGGNTVPYHINSNEATSKHQPSRTCRRTVNVEMCRFFGYVGGIVLLLIGTFVTNHYVQWPFDGEGFDAQATFIYELFGFNHTCTILDFNPSRTISAIAVMMSVGPFLMYVILNRFRMEHEYINGNIGYKLYILNKVFTPLMVISFGFFYLVFVNQPIDMTSFILHYIPYMNYQIGMGLLEVQQVEYLIQRKQRSLPLPWIIRKLPVWLLRIYGIVVVGVIVWYTVFVWSFIAGAPIIDTSTASGMRAGMFLMYFHIFVTTLIPGISSYLLTDTKYGSLVSIDFTTISHSPGGYLNVDTDGHDKDEESGSMMLPPSAISTSSGDSNDNLVAYTQHQQKYWSTVGMPKFNFSSKTAVSNFHNIQRVRGNIQRPPINGTHENYKFKNVVFQGGGSKGIIFAGTIHALDEVGVLPYLARFAGTSAGCIPALLLALGLDSAQVIEETNNLNMAEFFDGTSKTYNLMTKQGMHPGNKAIHYVEEILYKYTGDPNLTFIDLYRRFGTELCITVANISRSQSEYCHVNTSPDMKISLAIRASMSLPLLWQPIELHEGETYVDGGMFNNYALKAFDGWFLSTEKGNSVMELAAQLNQNVLTGDASNREVVSAYKEALTASFATVNKETIGFRISADESEDQAGYACYLDKLEEKLTHGRGESCHSSVLQYPNTPIARAFLERKAEDREQKKGSCLDNDNTLYEKAYVEMLRWMIANLADGESFTHSDIHPNAYIASNILSKLITNPPNAPFSPETFNCFSWDDVISKMDVAKKGYITCTDMGKFWGEYRVKHAHMKNRDVTEIRGKKHLIAELFNSMHVVFEENLLRDPDNAARTCTLRTHYVGLLDLELNQADKEFLYKSGRDGTLDWLQHKRT